MNIKLLARQFCDYSTYIRGYSSYTTKRYKQVITSFANFEGIEELGEINQENIRDFFLKGRVKAGWKSASYISYHNTLCVFFDWCIKEGRMKENPALEIEKPKLEKRIPPKLTKQESMRLLEVVLNYPYKYKYLRFRDHAIFAMFIFSGIRKKELLNLKYADVDLENLSIFINQGKGSKDRVIPICYRLAEILGKYLAERKRLKKTCPEFFTSLNRNMGLTETGMRRLAKRIKEASNINFTIHKLRHTFATLMLEGGCDIYSLSRMMGHNDIKTTTLYLAASSEHLRLQIAKHPLAK